MASSLIPLEIERRYLISHSFSYLSIPCLYEKVVIEQVYLQGKLRIRKSVQGGVATYTKTFKMTTDNPAVMFEKEEAISEQTYLWLLMHEHEGTPPLRKKRICFWYKGQFFELDIFDDIRLIMLEIELTDICIPVFLPPWLPVVKEVTDDPSYKNSSIAKMLKLEN